MGLEIVEIACFVLHVSDDRQPQPRNSEGQGDDRSRTQRDLDRPRERIGTKLLSQRAPGDECQARERWSSQRFFCREERMRGNGEPEFDRPAGTGLVRVQRRLKV